jgi:hypothetical protein
MDSITPFRKKTGCTMSGIESCKCGRGTGDDLTMESTASAGRPVSESDERTQPRPPSGCGSSASGSRSAASLFSWPSLSVVLPIDVAARGGSCSSSIYRAASLVVQPRSSRPGAARGPTFVFPAGMLWRLLER